MKRSDFLMIVTASTIALTTAVSGMAHAQGRDGFDRPEFGELDVDGDGQITAADLEALGAARFAEIDTDGDGQVSRAEFEASALLRATEQAGRMFERLDADGDGVLGRDVLEARNGGPSTRLVDRLDTDGDGGVSQEEFEAAQSRMAELRGKRGGFFRGGHGRN